MGGGGGGVGWGGILVWQVKCGLLCKHCKRGEPWDCSMVKSILAFRKSNSLGEVDASNRQNAAASASISVEGRGRSRGLVQVYHRVLKCKFTCRFQSPFSKHRVFLAPLSIIQILVHDP